MTDGNELSALFARWAEGEGILARISEEQCADLARAFMAGYAHGRAGNAEKIKLIPPLTLEDCQLSAELAVRQAVSDALTAAAPGVLILHDDRPVQHARNAVAAAFKLGQQGR